MPTGTLVRLDIRVDPASWQDKFDVLEVWRSRMTEDGPFEELTATNYMPARVPAARAQIRPPFPETRPAREPGRHRASQTCSSTR